jgi:hypothetical protein
LSWSEMEKPPVDELAKKMLCFSYGQLLST